jgi:Zn-dependent peptidase ImmA (M78 family)
MFGAPVRSAREAAGLSHETLAAWASFDAARLAAGEDESAPFSSDEADRIARIFGLRLDDLMAGEAGRAPLTLLLRDNSVASLDFRSLLSTEIGQALGEFQRVVRDIDDLERLVQRTRAVRPSMPVTLPGAGMHPGDHRARQVRAELGLSDEPIPSMRKLVEGLGATVVWVTEEQVDAILDGASVCVPREAILVNLVEEENKYPWRTRITLAHELGHLLFDMNSRARSVLVSPTTGHLRAAHAGTAFSNIEQIARAFAACLLAPTTGVQRVVGKRDPTSEDAIEAVGATFGVGRTVAINRLQHVFGLTDGQREQLILRSGAAYRGDFAEDEPPARLGFRGEPLFGLVKHALETERISPARARRFLALGPDSPLPFPELGDVVCAPRAAPENVILRAVYAFLADNHPGLSAGVPELRDGQWWAPLRHGTVGADKAAAAEAGYAVVSPAGVVERVVVDSPAR